MIITRCLLGVFLFSLKCRVVFILSSLFESVFEFLERPLIYEERIIVICFLVLCSHLWSRDFDVIPQFDGILQEWRRRRTMIRQNRMARELLRCKRLLNSWKWNFIRARYPCRPLFHGFTRFVVYRDRSLAEFDRLFTTAVRSSSFVVSFKIFPILRTFNVFYIILLL